MPASRPAAAPRVAVGPLLTLGLLFACLPLPAHAGSITASSIWNRRNALERAREQMPQGAVVTGEHCQEVEVGIGNIRYLCTVEYQPAPASATPAVPAPPAGSP